MSAAELELHPSLRASAHLLPALASALPALRSHVAQHGLWPSAWAAFYAHADPAQSFVLVVLLFSVGVYAAQQATGNSSQVDRLWTFLPVIFTAHFALHSLVVELGTALLDVAQDGWSPLLSVAKQAKPLVYPRLGLVLFCTVLWSVRLTSNAYRRGMFKSGEEDYRWAILKRNMSAWQWQLFSIFFIAIAQIILLGITGFPAYLLLTTTYLSESPNAHLIPRPIDQLHVGDVVLFALFFCNLYLQTKADNQQWVYQNYKRNQDPQQRQLTPQTRQKIEQQTGLTPWDAERGFNANGLFAFSRHPNFACEQANWWILYLWVPLTFVPSPWSSNGTSGLSWRQIFTYAAISPLSMNALFLASTNFTERITASKYASFGAYQRRVDMFWPVGTWLRARLVGLLQSQEEVRRLGQQIWGDSAGAARGLGQQGGRAGALLPDAGARHDLAGASTASGEQQTFQSKGKSGGYGTF